MLRPQGLATYNKVNFVHVARTDTIVNYQSGSAITTSNRLKAIQTYANGSLVTTYTMTYAQSPATNRSTLSSVTRCGSDGTCLPATAYTWTPSTGVTGTATTYNNVTIGGSGGVVLLGDFNGDGKQPRDGEHYE